MKIFGPKSVVCSATMVNFIHYVNFMPFYVRRFIPLTFNFHRSGCVIKQSYWF